MVWFRSGKQRYLDSGLPPIQADDAIKEPSKPTLLPLTVPAKSPKATYDVIDEVLRMDRTLPAPPIPAPMPKFGFTISSSKNGETSEVQLNSPTLTVAKARMLFKSGWRVHITNAAGRQFAPSEFDEVLKFD